MESPYFELNDIHSFTEAGA